MRLFFQISFGTNCWPTVPEYIDEVIQALLETEIPFVRFFLLYIFLCPASFLTFSLIQILCHASPFAKVPEETVRNINASGLGFLTPWGPQQFILNHPVWNLNSPHEVFRLISLLHLG